MILSNYWKWLDGVLKTDIYSDGYYDPTEDLGLVNTSGNAVLITLASSEHEVAWYSRDINNAEILFGSGSGSIAVDDYAMSSDCTSSLSDISFTQSSTGTNAGLNRTYTITGTNDGENSVTIREVGIAKNIKWHDRNDGYQTSSILIAKVKLATALTVAPNENFIINLAWNEV